MIYIVYKPNMHLTEVHLLNLTKASEHYTSRCDIPVSKGNFNSCLVAH